MKSISFLICISILFCLNANSQDLKKLSASELDKDKLMIAQEFTIKYFTRLKDGGYYEFQNEAIDALKNQLTEQNQKTLYQQLKSQLGDYQGLEYAETWSQNSMLIFRFKSDWDKSDQKLEVRVVLDGSDKIAGFWIKPWSDELK